MRYATVSRQRQIGLLEDLNEYKAFEEAIAADYDAQSTVERELVLRLASLLWRLRRATAMETGLFAMQAEHLRHDKQELPAVSREIIQLMFAKPDVTRPSVAQGGDTAKRYGDDDPCGQTQPGTVGNDDLARCFLRLANLPTYPLDRLNRYEATLWRQVARILFALDTLDRRKPQEPWRGMSLEGVEFE
jgi:hypothetical protein